MFSTAIAVLLLLAWLTGCVSNPGSSTLVRAGQEAPGFVVTTLEGSKISLSDLRGRVVLINFFATWCPPCRAEMPHLEKEVWQKWQGDKFTVLAIGRGHANEELVPFRKEMQLTFPMAGDPHQNVFAQYAREYIPRNFVIGADGRIAYESVGYNPREFAALREAVRAEIAKIR